MSSLPKRSSPRSTAFSKPDALSRTSTSACSIFPPSSINRMSISAGSSARTASAFTIARTKDSRAANRSTRATSAPATPFSNFYVVAGLPLLGVPPLLGKTGAFFLVSSWAKRRTSTARSSPAQTVSDFDRPSRKPPERLRQPLPAFRRPPAHRLARMGRRRLCPRQIRGQAHPPRYRRGLVPLVPRHRPRKLRERRSSQNHQRAIRRRESRPRRAPRRRLQLSIRRQRHFRPGRLAAHRLSAL